MVGVDHDQIGLVCIIKVGDKINFDGVMEMVRCYRCGEQIPDSNAIEALGQLYCKECFDNYFCYCEKCGKPERRSFVGSRAYDVDGKHYCRECYEETPTCCDNCGAVIPRKSEVIRRGGHRYCRDCFNKLYLECDVCNLDWLRGEMITVGEHHYCCECFASEFLEKWDGTPCVIKKG